LQGEEEGENEDELEAQLEAAMIARMKKIKDVNKLENQDKDRDIKLYVCNSPGENIKNNKEKGSYL
jgi:hypothetical protein